MPSVGYVTGTQFTNWKPILLMSTVVYQFQLPKKVSGETFSHILTLDPCTLNTIILTQVLQLLYSIS